MNRFYGKKLLILGGIKLACDIVKSAKRMGAYVIVADYNEDSPAKKSTQITIPRGIVKPAAAALKESLSVAVPLLLSV